MILKVIIKKMWLFIVIRSCAIVVKRYKLLLKLDVNFGVAEGELGDGKWEECIQNFSNVAIWFFHVFSVYSDNFKLFFYNH